MRKDGNYVSYIDINYKIEDINKVSVYWTLTNPLNNPISLFKKPHIYLNEITLHLMEVSQRFNFKTFKPVNPAHPIKLKEEIFLNQSS